MGLPIGDLLFMTWRSLTGNLVRSGLTTLGIFMGVAAVSGTLNIQTITNKQIALKLAARDKPYVVPWLQPQSGFTSPEIGEADQQALKQALPTIRSISKVAHIYGMQSVQFAGQEVKDIDALSVPINYLETTGRRMVDGRFFDRADFDQYRPVAIIDESLAAALFKGQNSIRQAIYAAGSRFVVVGVTQTKSFGSESKIQGTLWLTENYTNALQGKSPYSTLHISPYQLREIKELKTKVEEILLQRYPQTTVYVGSNAKDLIQQEEAQRIASAALMLVGLVALAIGGVGIANITVASVVERTKEIGIRRALGATQYEIMLQFIVEAVLLSIIGGAIAIITVHGVTYVATTVVFQAPYKFSLSNAVLAMGSALLVGVGASFFPALRAAQIDIVHALRSE